MFPVPLRIVREWHSIRGGAGGVTEGAADPRQGDPVQELSRVLGQLAVLLNRHYFLADELRVRVFRKLPSWPFGIDVLQNIMIPALHEACGGREIRRSLQKGQAHKGCFQSGKNRERVEIKVMRHL